MPVTPKPIEIYSFYSHADEELRDESDDHLNTADVILLLISSNFLASDYCYDVEMKRTMERHEAGEARVILVILRLVDWEDASFSKLLALPTDGKAVTSWSNRDEAFENVAQGIRAAVEELAGPSAGLPPSIGTAPDKSMQEKVGKS
jgi:hypothetical protein